MRKLVACLVALVAGGAANAAPIIYYGLDAGVGPAGTWTNSNAARASFLAATGAVPTITFEGLATGSIPGGGLVVAPGVTLTAFNNGFGGIRTGDDIITGYNTTPLGNRYAEVDIGTAPGGFNFNFATPIDAFGAYFTGVGTSSGTAQVLFNNGTSQSFNITGSDSGGILFWGFTDFGNQISQVRVQLAGGTGDIYALDDVRFRSAAPIPEPISMIVFGSLVVGGIVAVRRRVKVAA